MKNLILLILLVISVIVFNFATPTAAHAKTLGNRNEKGTKKLSTNVNFEDMLVDGKYQYSDESLTTVENEKNLDDLLGVRKQFKDRMARSLDRQ